MDKEKYKEQEEVEEKEEDSEMRRGRLDTMMDEDNVMNSRGSGQSEKRTLSKSESRYERGREQERENNRER